MHSIVSQNKQVLNVDDTYYVISGTDFAIFTSLIYLVIGVFFLFFEKYSSFGIKVLQYIMFNIPFVYFMLSDVIDYENPGYYLANPIAYKWKAEFIPLGLILCFGISIVLFFSLFVFTFWKWKKKVR